MSTKEKCYFLGGLQQQKGAAAARCDTVNKDTKERLKNELGIEIKDNPVDVELRLADRLLKNPDNFYPELSPNYELFKSARKSRWGQLVNRYLSGESDTTSLYLWNTMNICNAVCIYFQNLRKN